MREFAKSALSFSWAISLLGLKQAVNLARPERQAKDDVFAPITQAAVNQLDDSMRGMYRFGDNLQKRMVDMALWWIDPKTLTDPSKWGFGRPKDAGETPAAATADAADPSTDTQGQSAEAAESCCDQAN